MKTVLITGADGQLGTEIKILAEKQKTINFIFSDIYELDITKIVDINSFSQKKIDLIINCAAYTNVDKAEKDIEKANLINVLGAKNISSLAQKLDIPIIHISTDYVFDGCNFKPYIEDDHTNPINVYGKTKLLGENAVRAYPKHIIIRTSWLYSSYGNNFVNTILKLAKEKEQIQVVADQIGSPTYAADLADTLLTISNKYFETETVKFGIYNYTNQGVCSWYDFAKEILDFTNSATKIEPTTSNKFKRAASRPYYSVLDKLKITQTFALEIPHWRDSLKKMLALL